MPMDGSFHLTALKSPSAADDGPPSRRVVPSCVGLGTGPGGQLARSCLAGSASALLGGPSSAKSTVRVGPKGALLEPAPLTAREPRNAKDSFSEGREPSGMFLALLLNDMAPPAPEDLLLVQSHRWSFKGAEGLAQKGRGFCAFIRCLLELQRTVQVEEEGEPLDPTLAGACKTFVAANCRQGNMGEMYQLLTHFISNSLVFHEWNRFLMNAFENERAHQEAFLVPHLEQVWTRFCRLRAVLESIFNVLNTCFIWRHRLPEVGEVVREHMKRRCFASEAVRRNELFLQATVRSEIVKQVKFTFNVGDL